MLAEVALPAAFGTALVGTFVLTPLAIRLARRTGFLDHPMGYKGHVRPTPYLGGVALAGGVAASAVAWGGGAASTYVLLGCALGLGALGTLDDRRNLSPLARVVFEIGMALVLWATGHGWDVLGSGPADAMLTVLWVVGIVNAFNLMDNMNGTCATCAGVSALGAAALGLDGGQDALAALCVGIAGACAGFLPFNLVRPSAIFMGDGGSMLLGTLVAGVTISAASLGDAGLSGLLPAGLITGLAIFDTALVSVSRRRGRRPLLTGGRDHLTHRLSRRLGSPERVPGVLAAVQAVLCAVALAAVHAGALWVLVGGAVAVAVAVYAGYRLEGPAWFTATPPVPRPGERTPIGSGASSSGVGYRRPPPGRSSPHSERS